MLSKPGLWSLLLLCLLPAAFLIRLAQSATCPSLDSNGCCGQACRQQQCQALHVVGATLGAVPRPNMPAWKNSSGWKGVFNDPSLSSSAACQQYLKAGSATAAPGYCSWYGISCSAAAHSNTCSQSGGSYAVTQIELVNNDLSGYINSTGFMESLQQLHDCGLTKFIIGGACFELRGTISPLFGKLNRLQTLGIFTTNITGNLPPAMGDMKALEELYLQGEDRSRRQAP